MPGPVFRDFFDELRSFDVTADILLWVFLPILLFDTATKLDGRELLDDLGPILILAVVAVLMTTAAAGLAVWAISGFSLVDLPSGGGDHRHHRSQRRHRGVPRGRRAAPADPAGRGREPAQRCGGDRALHHAAGPGDQPRRARTRSPSSRGSRVESGDRVRRRRAGRRRARPGRRRRGQPHRPGRPRRGHAQRRPGLSLLCAVGEPICTSPAWSPWSWPASSSARSAGCAIGTKEWQSVSAIWTQLGFWASSLVFVLASMLVPSTIRQATGTDLLLLAALLVGALAARALCLFGVLPIVRILLRQRPISAASSWSSSGAACAARSPWRWPWRSARTPRVPPDVRHLVSVLATGFVLFTLLVQATTLRPLIRWLGVDQLDPVERILRARALALTQGEILDRLSETAIIHGLDLEAAEEVGALYRKRVEALERVRRGRRGDAAPAARRGAGDDHRARGHLLYRRDGRRDDLARGRLDPAQPDQRPAGRDQGRRGRSPIARRRAPTSGAISGPRSPPSSTAGSASTGPLAYRMAQRIELRLIQRRVLEGLIELHPQPHPRPVRRAGQRGGAPT